MAIILWSTGNWKDTKISEFFQIRWNFSLLVTKLILLLWHFVSCEVKVCNVMIITVECLLMATSAQRPENIVPVTISCTDTTCNRTTYMWLIVCFILVLCPKQTVTWMWMEVQGELLLCMEDSRLKLKLGKLSWQKTDTSHCKICPGAKRKSWLFTINKNISGSNGTSER